MSAETRTGPIVVKLVAGLQEDLEEIAESLRKGRDLARGLESVARGVNGLSAFLKAKGNELDNILTGLEEESANVAKKMVGTPLTPVITTTVDLSHTEKVLRAKGDKP